MLKSGNEQYLKATTGSGNISIEKRQDTLHHGLSITTPTDISNSSRMKSSLQLETKLMITTLAV
jgi:hypothetical protein